MEVSMTLGRCIVEHVCLEAEREEQETFFEDSDRKKWNLGQLHISVAKWCPYLTHFP